MNTRKTKIVCTIGPASSSREAIRSLIRKGMDVARLNFSHGDHVTYKKIAKLIRDESGNLKKGSGNPAGPAGHKDQGRACQQRFSRA